MPPQDEHRDSPQSSRNDDADDDTYSIRPAESAPRKERRRSVPPVEPSGAAPEQSQRRKRKRPRAERPATDDFESPPAPWQQQAAEEEEKKWVADTGWREPRLISALWYPVVDGGWKVVVVYTLVLWAGVVFAGPIFGFPVMIFLSFLLLVTASYTLEGIPSAPQFPELSWDTISIGMLGLVAFMISGAPLILGTLIMAKTGVANPYVVILLLAVSMFYVPIAFLALAERPNESGLNPLRVLRGMMTIFAPYLALCAIAAGVLLTPLMVLAVAGAHAFVQNLVQVFLIVYVTTALVRAVALIARKHEWLFGEPDEDDATDV